MAAPTRIATPSRGIYNYDNKYECNELPENATPAWTRSIIFDPPDTEEINPAGQFHVVDDGTGNSGYTATASVIITDDYPRWSFIELRHKALVWGVDTGLNIQFTSGGGQTISFNLNKTSVRFVDTWTRSETNDWVTYLALLQRVDDNNINVSLYVDGTQRINTTQSIVGIYASLGFPKVIITAGSGYPYEYYFDYIYYGTLKPKWTSAPTHIGAPTR